jgi:hypothetical protein
MATRTAEYWQTIIQALILVVLALTAWILGWYTKETYRLRRESERQTELLLRPFVIAEFVPTPEPAAPVLFKVQNIGNSAALNIKISVLDEFWVIEIPFLAHGGSRTFKVVLQAGSSTAGLSTHDTLVTSAIIQHAPRSLQIEFENTERQKYLVAEAVSLRQIKITESSTRHS